MLRLYIDFALIPLEQHSVLTDATFTFEFAMTDDFNNDNYGLEPSTKRNFSSDLTFYADAANYLKSKLITNNITGDAKVTVEIKDDCCATSEQVLYRGKAYKKDISWCNIDKSAMIDCEVSLKTEEDTETSNAYDCLRGALIAKRETEINGVRFDAMPHAFVPYCKEVRPRAFQDFFYFLFFILAIALTWIAVAYKVYAKIIGFVGTVAGILGLTGISNTLKGIEKGIDIIDDTISNYISGCGKGNVAPRITDYIKNACAQCNLQFSSSVLNNTDSIYWKAVMFQSFAELPGFHWWDSTAPLSDINDDWYRLNSPVLNGTEFMNMLRKEFGCQWWIDGTTLYFEAVIPNVNNLWIDFSVATENEKITKLCFEGSDKTPAAGFHFLHTDDSSDMIGDEGKYYYNDLVDWTKSLNAYNGVNRTDIFGLKTQITPFAASRFKRDGITRDILRFWNEFEIYRNTSAFGVFFQILKLPSLFLSKINPLTDGYENFKHNLLLQQGVARIPKLLILEEINPNGSTVVREGPFYINDTNDCFLYNTAFWFADNDDYKLENKIYRTPGLFDFWKNINPNKNVGATNIQFTMEIIYNCVDVANLYNFLHSNNPKNIFIKIVIDGITYSSRPINSITLTENTISIKGMV